MDHATVVGVTASLCDPDQTTEVRGARPRLHGRSAQCARVERLLEDSTSGRAAGALRVIGGRGIGKSTLLDHVAARAEGSQVLRVRGVSEERELPYAGLQLLCAPLVDDLVGLEPAQREALSAAIGLSGSAPPDRFLVSVAALNLLTGVAQRKPLCCVVDDAHLVDHASLLVLAFVARRAERSPLVIVFGELEQASRAELDGLPATRLEALDRDEALAVLSAAAPADIDTAVTERMLLEARGNPRALLQAVDGTTAAELAGGYAVPVPRPDARDRDHDCERRAGRMTVEARRLLLLVAAEPTGDPALVWRAAGRLGIGPHAAEVLETEDLLTFGPRVVLGCTRLRAALYSGATRAEVRQVHRALAGAVAGDAHADRRAWHLALSTSGLDDRIADDLETSATTAQRRGGVAARAAFMERAALLTSDPAIRARRALVAAGAKHTTGDVDAAQRLLTIAESGPPNAEIEARIELQRARIAFGTRRDDTPTRLLLRAARRIRPHSSALARTAHLEALVAGMLSCPTLAAANLREAARAARESVEPASVEPIDLLLDALATRVLDGRDRAADELGRVVARFAGDGVDSATRGWSWLAGWVAADAWNEPAWAALTSPDPHPTGNNDGDGHDFLASGWAAVQSTLLEVHRGRFDAAAAGAAPATSASLLLAAWQGRLEVLHGALPRVRQEAREHGDPLTVAATHLAEAVLHNGMGHYEQAMAAARRATESDQLALSRWAAAELIEAAVRCGRLDLAAASLARLGDDADHAATPWARGVRATAQALLADGPAAAALYQDAIDWLSQTGIRVHLARAQLLYGEWLRRQNRRIDARVPLRAAQQTFSTIGAAGFAARARAELLATGERARSRTVGTDRQLTPQESRIGYLAKDGLTNSQIGARLFVSPRTVEYHLHKVFAKLGITSRTELHLVLRPGGDALGKVGPGHGSPGH
ncbi:AAA family ATPase [Nocardioides sp. YIM 152315]|nr:LuxR family transcriptional regulator [Nocardioides sp. YIM 152315]MDF1603224.1 AAA family ATPase [Nocardioides sp. YIM 152315]